MVCGRSPLSDEIRGLGSEAGGESGRLAGPWPHLDPGPPLTARNLIMGIPIRYAPDLGSRVP